MKRTIYILIIAISFSCQSIVTENETNAVTEVLNFYGGVCNRSIGYAVENSKSGKFFELEISESEALKALAPYPKIVSSNVAQLFYNGLNKEESNYEEIRVILKPSKEKSIENKFSSDELERIIKIIPFFQSTTKLLKKKDYESLYNTFDKDLNPTITLERLKEFSSKADSIYGEIIDKPIFHGYAISQNTELNKEVIQLAGILPSKIKHTPISVYLNGENNKILSIEYKW